MDATRAPDDGDRTVTALEERLQATEGLWVDGHVDRPTFLSMRGELETRLRAARRPPTPSVTHVNRAWWDAALLPAKRAVVDALVHRVTVGPAVRGRNRYDPSRLTVEWRV